MDKLARRKDDILVLRKNVGNYINFSSNTKFGMKYFGRQHEYNPLGIYGFELTADIVDLLELHGKSANSEEEAGSKAEVNDELESLTHGFMGKKFINIFSPTKQIVNLDSARDLKQKIYLLMSRKYGKVIRESGLRELKKQYESLEPCSYLFLALDYLIDVGAYSNYNVASNILFRSIGYSVIRTDDMFFQDGFDHQLIVLEPTACNLIATVNNPYYESSEINEVEENTEGLWEKKQREDREYQAERKRIREEYKRLENKMLQKNKVAYNSLLDISGEYCTLLGAR